MYVKYFKRFIDIIVSLILIVITAPLLILLILLTFLVQGEVFFFQRRPGYRGKLFTVYKFRTMNNKRGEDGILLPDQQRITRLGLFLRKTNLDELPQLFNVFFGSMSLVGPRPFLTEYLNFYTEEQAKRHNVKPGITGWAQINGGNNISWPDKINYDVEYVEKVSLGFDLKILLITFFRLITLKGFDTGTFIPEKFKGKE